RVLGVRDSGLDPLPVCVAARTVVESRAREPVAVRHLDGGYTGLVEGPHDPAHRRGRDLMPDGVHAVAECDVLNVDRGHRATAFSRPAMRSATRIAAEVMMSRLPA